MTQMEKLLASFNRERNEAFLSLDEQKIRRYYRKWNDGKEMPKDPKIFWGSVHKAITGNGQLPIEFRRKSKAWLTERGLKGLDDGEL